MVALAVLKKSIAKEESVCSMLFVMLLGDEQAASVVASSAVATVFVMLFILFVYYIYTKHLTARFRSFFFFFFFYMIDVKKQRGVTNKYIFFEKILLKYNLTYL